MSFPHKVLRSIKKSLGQYDFNHEVKDSMDACLACKACTTACPIKVDVPTFRSKFIEAYYSRYLRPISDYLVANVENILPTLGGAPKFSNFVANNPVSAWVTRNVIGYVDAPKFTKSLKKILPKDVWYHDSTVNGMSAEQKKRSVFIVQDPFTSNYESQLLYDTVESLKKLGFTPMVLPFYANGKPAHVKGFLSKFEKQAKRATTFFNQVATHNIPMIGLDASLVFAYRDEYVKALGADKVNFQVELLSEWLVKQPIQARAAKTSNDYTLLNHCTEKSLLTGVEKHWQTIFDKVGLRLEYQSAGCCGMAGTFGHEKANQAISEELYNLSWKDKVESIGPDKLLATGFSCRCQVKRMFGQLIQHPIQVLAKSLEQ